MAARATVEILVALRDAVSGPMASIRKSFATAFSGIRGIVAGVAGGGALGLLIKSVTQTETAMTRLAKSTQSTVESISRLKFALATIGKGDDVAGILNQLEGKRADALRGPSQARDAFRILGLDTNELRGKSAADLLREIAEGYRQAGQSADAAAQLQAIFGDQFRELLPLLSQGAQGFDDLGRRADALGVTISTDSALNAAELTKQWVEFGSQIDKVFRSIVDLFIPALSTGLKFVNDLILEFKGFSFSALTESDQLKNLEKLLSLPQGTRIQGLDEAQKGALSSYGAILEGFGNDTFEVVGQVEEALKKVRERLAELNKPIDAAQPNQFWLGFREQINKTRNSLNELKDLGKQTAGALQDAFSSNITSAIRAVRTGALSVKDALDSLLDGLIDDLAEFATSELVKRLIGAGLNFLFGAAAAGGGTGGTNPDIGPPTASGGGGNGLLGGGLGGFKQLGRGGGGTTINVYGAQTREDQMATTEAITRNLIARNRQVRLELRAAV